MKIELDVFVSDRGSTKTRSTVKVTMEGPGENVSDVLEALNEAFGQENVR